MQGGYFLCKWLDLHVEIGLRVEESGKQTENRWHDIGIRSQGGLNSRVRINRVFNRVIFAFNNALIRLTERRNCFIDVKIEKSTS